MTDEAKKLLLEARTYIDLLDHGAPHTGGCPFCLVVDQIDAYLARPEPADEAIDSAIAKSKEGK
jgi:hypothetical protein